MKCSYCRTCVFTVLWKICFFFAFTFCGTSTIQFAKPQIHWRESFWLSGTSISIEFHAKRYEDKVGKKSHWVNESQTEPNQLTSLNEKNQKKNFFLEFFFSSHYAQNSNVPSTMANGILFYSICISIGDKVHSFLLRFRSLSLLLVATL